MVNNNIIYNEIVEILEKAKMSSAAHLKCISLLEAVYKKYEFEDFIQQLIKSLQVILATDHNVKNIYNEKLIVFFALFCTSFKPDLSQTGSLIEHPILSRIFHFLLESQCLKFVEIRYWSCKLISQILENLEELSDELSDKLEEAMLERINDSKVSIRLQAIECIYRLQDSTSEDDQVIDKFVTLIDGDASAKIRQLCLQKVAIRQYDVLSKIVGRIRDVDENVRLAAFHRLIKLPKCLTIEVKRTIIRSGFLDNSVRVKQFMGTKFVQNWLEIYDSDYLNFLKALRLDANEEDIKGTTIIVEYVLEALFKTQPIRELIEVIQVNDKNIIPFEELGWETSIFWRFLVQYLRQSEDYENLLNCIIPDLVHMCIYIKDYIGCIKKEKPTNDFLQHQFVLKQLFQITKGYDVGDSASRESLNSTVSYILLNETLTQEVAEIILANLEITIPNNEQRSLFVCEIISEIICPINSKETQKRELDFNFDLSQLKTKLNCLLEKQSIAVKEENFLEADKVKNEIETLNRKISELKCIKEEDEQLKKKCDVSTIMKYLNIAEALLISPKITKLTPSLLTLKESVIHEVLIHPYMTVMIKAFKCFALCCLVDKKSAILGIHLFSKPILTYEAGEECEVEMLIVCISAVVDLIRIYGSSLVAAPNDELSESLKESHLMVFAGGTSLTVLIRGLVDLMDDEKDEIQAIAGKGLCLLVIGERIQSDSLIARLILKWCNPATEVEELKQFIGHTLAILPSKHNYAAYLEGAVIITIKTIILAPTVSPLADINILNIAKFLLVWCKTSVEGSVIHTNLAIRICHEMRKTPKIKVNYIYSKMLLMLDLPECKSTVQELLNVCDELRNVIREKPIEYNIIKYIGFLNLKINSESKCVEELKGEK